MSAWESREGAMLWATVTHPHFCFRVADFSIEMALRPEMHTCAGGLAGDTARSALWYDDHDRWV